MTQRLNGKPGPALLNEGDGNPADEGAIAEATAPINVASFPVPPADYFARATWATFRLEGIDVEIGHVIDAFAHGQDRPTLRSRQAQRLRNHAAILHHIETDLRSAQTLTPDAVIRWYTGIGAGLSTTSLDQSTSERLEEVVRRINSPQFRIRAALQEVAQAYTRLIADPLVPSFNGILSRLLLRYHMGRCGLPAIVLDPVLDGRFGNAENAARRLVELLEATYDAALKARE